MTPDEAAAGVVSALQSWDHAAYNAAGRALIAACRAASAEEVERGLVCLAPVLAEVELGRASALADTAAVMAFGLSDVSPFLGMFVTRACQAMESAAEFRSLYNDVLGEPPSSTDQSAFSATVERFKAAGARTSDPVGLAEAWFYGNAWVRPALMLSQRAEVRAAMPERERLLRAIEAIGDDFDNAEFLYGLLLVLDEAPVLVLHRPSGRGFRVVIDGVGDSRQLHTLLAARLIGDPDAGWLPGEPPTAAMLAAADGSGDWNLPGGIIGQFDMADAYGRPVEHMPAYIPLLDGERVVVLDPATDPRRWTFGRRYPLMTPALRVDAVLAGDVAAAWLARVRPVQPDEGPTDDLAIPGHDAAEIVDCVLGEKLNGAPAPTIQRLLVSRFGLSNADAVIAWDRTLGGVFRAGTHPRNRPDPEKDPVAAEAYRRATDDPTLRRLVSVAPR
ncbi:hypothetical protein GCM10023322_11470 [Rugosimonospora acidiphila]|uniref:Uncharacterized protein n=2 Tax=Rugosimonospora acidiphila TaxID=556531 RepID=A0ABP9RMH5_9ACTN